MNHGILYRNMDIDLLAKMVRDLILDKDEVSLPGVGSFVAEMVPASFSDRGYTINPPYRRLSFRQRTDASDMSLADLYAASNGVDREQALQILTDFLSEMKEVLKTKKSIVFPELGRLRATKENIFFFVADGDLDIWPGGYGLEPISLKTHQETPEEVSSMVEELRSMIADPTDREAVDTPVESLAAESVEAESSVKGEALEVTEARTEEETADEPAVIAAAPTEEIEAPAAAPDIIDAPEEITVAPTTEESVIEESTADETATGAPMAEEPTIEESTAEEPITEETVAEVPMAEESVIEESTTEETVTGAPMTEESTTEEPITEETVAEAPMAEESTIEEPADETGDPVKTVTPVVEASVETAGDDAVKPKRTGKIALYIVLGLLAAAILALVVFVILAHAAPDFIDSLLYTPEELELIRSFR